MKQLHRRDLYGWSVFNSQRNIDFHSVLWVREGGNVAIDPLPLSEHDAGHLAELGSVATVIVTNSDHTRAARDIGDQYGATVCGPAAERDSFPIACDQWLADGDEPVPGLRVIALDGSKTPGELALVIAGDTLVVGDLVRAHEGGALCMLPDAKLTDRTRAVASVARLAELTGIRAVLPGDGWPVFRDGSAVLRELADAYSGK